LKVIENVAARQIILYNFLLIRYNIALSATVFELFDVEWYHDLEIWITGHSSSFKPVPFESLGVVCY